MLTYTRIAFTIANEPEVTLFFADFLLNSAAEKDR